MSKLTSISVTYYLDEQQVEQLNQLTNRWNDKISACQDPESLFRMIMQDSSTSTINDRMSLWAELINK